MSETNRTTVPDSEAPQDPRHAVIARALRHHGSREVVRVWGRDAIEGGSEHNVWAGTPEDVADDVVRALWASEHLPSAPQAEGDVREALAEVFRQFPLLVGHKDAPTNMATAVLSSGLVVPVGEVERLKGAALDEIGKAAGETINALVELDEARRERDTALAAVEDGADPRESQHVECDCVPHLGPPHCHLCSTVVGREVEWSKCQRLVPARLLSGVHVGREVVLPDGMTGQITATPCVRLDLWNSSTGEGNPLKIRHIRPDDVVTLVAESGS